MISNWRRYRVGIVVEEEEVRAAGVRGDRVLWRRTVPVLPGDSLRDSISRLFPHGNGASLLVPSVVAAVGHRYARIRSLPGIPEKLSHDDVQDLIQTNWHRFFISTFTEAEVSSTERISDGSWRAALMDAMGVRELFEACRLSGLALTAVIPAAEPMVTGHQATVRSDSEIGALRSLDAASVARYRLGSGMELIPAEMTDSRQASHLRRMKFASALLVATLFVGWLAIESKQQLGERQMRREVQRLRSEEAQLLSQLDSLVSVSAELSKTNEAMQSAIPVLADLARIDSLVPDTAFVQQVRLDSTGTEITLIADDVASVVREIALLQPTTVILGSFANEPAPSTLQRAVLRLPRARRHADMVSSTATDRDQSDTRLQWVRLSRLLHHRVEIDSVLESRKSALATEHAGMLPHVPSALLVATMAQTIAEIADNAGVEAGQPAISIDSSAKVERAITHLSFNADPDATIVFLDSLDKRPVRNWTRALRLTRSRESQRGSAAWYGEIEIQTLVQAGKR